MSFDAYGHRPDGRVEYVDMNGRREIVKKIKVLFGQRKSCCTLAPSTFIHPDNPTSRAITKIGSAQYGIAYLKKNATGNREAVK